LLLLLSQIKFIIITKNSKENLFKRLKTNFIIIKIIIIKAIILVNITMKIINNTGLLFFSLFLECDENYYNFIVFIIKIIFKYVTQLIIYQLHFSQQN
jgi:hypothetical protein